MRKEVCLLQNNINHVIDVQRQQGVSFVSLILNNSIMLKNPSAILVDIEQSTAQIR